MSYRWLALENGLRLRTEDNSGAILREPTWAERMAAIPWQTWLRLGDPASPFADSSGNGHAGAAVGNLLYDQAGLVVGDPDGAISVASFQAGYVDVAFQPDRTRDLTVVALVDLIASSGNQVIVSQKGGTGTGRSLIFVNGPGNYIGTQVGGGGTQLQMPGFTHGAKHLLALTYAAASRATYLYLDGAQSGAHVGSAGDNSNGDLLVGINFAATGAGLVTGSVVDEVAYAYEVLDPATIAALWGAANAG